ERLHLRVCLNTLGGYTQFKTVRKTNDGPCKYVALFRGAQLSDEMPINFQFIESQFVQVIQARISGAEIVNDDSDAGITEHLQHVTCGAKICNQSAFSNFYLEAVRWQPSVVENPLYCSWQSSVAELCR